MGKGNLDFTVSGYLTLKLNSNKNIKVLKLKLISNFDK